MSEDKSIRTDSVVLCDRVSEQDLIDHISQNVDVFEGFRAGRRV